jgi:uncharacterized damage-inducible protein DinB
MILTISLALGASALYAQGSAAPAGNPAVTEARQAYNQIKTNWTGLAAKMPAESYDFKPVPEIRSFGELVAHVADAQMNYCSTAAGQAKRGDAATKKTKDDLVAALKASFDECDAAWEGTTEANAMQLMGGGRMQRSRLGTLINNTTHDNEEYGYGAVYLRLKGIVPPSSDRSGMGGRGGR